MSTQKSINRICVAAIVLGLIVTILFMNGAALGIQAADRTMGYESRLFDTSKVHTIEIVMDDWDGFIENCEHTWGDNQELDMCLSQESRRNQGCEVPSNLN